MINHDSNIVEVLVTTKDEDKAKAIQNDRGFKATIHDLGYFGTKYNCGFSVYFEDENTLVGEELANSYDVPIFRSVMENVKATVRDTLSARWKAQKILEIVDNTRMFITTLGIRPSGTYAPFWYAVCDLRCETVLDSVDNCTVFVSKVSALCKRWEH